MTGGPSGSGIETVRDRRNQRGEGTTAVRDTDAGERVAAYALDRDHADRLWKLSLGLIGRAPETLLLRVRR